MMIKKQIVGLIFGCNILLADGLVTFYANTPAKASEVNQNFTYLNNKIGNMVVKSNNTSLGYYVNEYEGYNNLTSEMSGLLNYNVSKILTSKGYILNIYKRTIKDDDSNYTTKTSIGFPKITGQKLFNSSNCSDSDELYFMQTDYTNSISYFSAINNSSSLFSNNTVFRTIIKEQDFDFILSDGLYYIDSSNSISPNGLYYIDGNDNCVQVSNVADSITVPKLIENDSTVTGIANDITLDNTTITIEAGSL